MIRIKLNREQFYLIALYLISVFCVLFFPSTVAVVVSIGFVLVAIVFEHNSYQRGNTYVSTIILLFPIILSVFQNIYIGLASERIDSSDLQVLLSLHFLLFSVVAFLGMKRDFRKMGWVFLLIGILLLFAIPLYFKNPTNMVALLSSVRNVLSCMLLYCFGCVLSKKADQNLFFKYIIILSWFVVLFGLMEWLSGNAIWKSLGITKLWSLKGISTNEYGVPVNWYSSEIIGGKTLRRMASSFADPVNLGTFLFAAFMIAWYKREKILMSALLICMILTMSKGALLGLLVFIVVVMWEKKGSRSITPLIIALVILFSGWFIGFSKSSSTGSLMVHLNGFLNALRGFVDHPFGFGLGNVGVLARVLGSTMVGNGVVETGIGMIIAQLGIVGIIVYGVFFAKLWTEPLKWNGFHGRERTLYYSLLISFIANAMFNEVALSPNSCGLYFISLAYLNSKICNPENKTFS